MTTLPGRRDDPLDPDLFAVLAAGHERFVGCPLTPHGEGPAWLYGEATFGVLAHTAEAVPRFAYAGVAAASGSRR